MMHKAWSSIEEVPYCFWRSSVKYQGHTGWKIDDWNPIWVRLLGRSQLSNPSDLPCLVIVRALVPTLLHVWNSNLQTHKIQPHTVALKKTLYSWSACALLLCPWALGPSSWDELGNTGITFIQPTQSPHPIQYWPSTILYHIIIYYYIRPTLNIFFKTSPILQKRHQSW